MAQKGILVSAGSAALISAIRDNECDRMIRSKEQLGYGADYAIRRH
jgi:hypothetical protein